MNIVAIVLAAAGHNYSKNNCKHAIHRKIMKHLLRRVGIYVNGDKTIQAIFIIVYFK